VMVQPYVHAIDADGEIDVVLFNGTFSHAVKKRPALGRPGSYREPVGADGVGRHRPRRPWR
jgi:hypothetical protein